MISVFDLHAKSPDGSGSQRFNPNYTSTDAWRLHPWQPCGTFNYSYATKRQPPPGAIALPIGPLIRQSLNALGALDATTLADSLGAIF